MPIGNIDLASGRAFRAHLLLAIYNVPVSTFQWPSIRKGNNMRTITLEPNSFHIPKPKTNLCPCHRPVIWRRSSAAGSLPPRRLSFRTIVAADRSSKWHVVSPLASSRPPPSPRPPSLTVSSSPLAPPPSPLTTKPTSHINKVRAQLARSHQPVSSTKARGKRDWRDDLRLIWEAITE